MMLLSVITALAALALTWLYLRRKGYASTWQTLLVVGLVAFNWRTVVLASGLYSEMFYMALSIVGLYLTEEYEDRQDKWRIGLAAGIILGFAFLTRTSGISLVVAVGAYFLLRRNLKGAVLPLGIASIFILAWISWCYLNRPHDQGVNSAYYESYFQTYAHLIRNAQGPGQSSILAIVSRMVAKNFLMLVPVSIPIVCAALSYDWPRNFGTEGQVLGFVLFSICLILTVAGFLRLRARFGALRLMQIYVITYLGLQILWPYSGYDRFLMPLLPFLLVFLITGFAHPVNLVRAELSQGRVVNKITAVFVASALVLLIVAASSAYAYGAYGSVLKAKRSWVARAEEDREAIQWINERTDQHDVLVCYRDPTYYLYTGRKATRCSPLRTGGLTTAQSDDFDEQAKSIFEVIRENDARYLIMTSSDMEMESRADLYRQTYRALLNEHPEIFVPVFKSGSGAVVYRIESVFEH
jgi:hypothetical protein